MPEQYTTTVKARELRKGDLISGVEGPHEVESASVKQKYVHVTMVDGDGKVGYFEKDQPFDVTRWRQTPAERAADELQGALRSIDHQERRDRAHLADAQEKMAKAMAKGQHVGWHEVEALALAQELVRIWDMIVNVHTARNRKLISGEEHVFHSFARHLTDDEIDEFGPVSRMDAIEAVRTTLVQKTLSELRYSNNSSSAASNLFAAYRLEAQTKWIEEREWDAAFVIGNVLR